MRLIPSVSIKDHLQGSLDAPIVLVEYGDYECPYCADFYFTVKKLREKLGSKLAFVFRNFPLDMHPNAFHAAVAAEIMAKYDKFWPMHDMLYENQNQLGDNYLLNYAEKLGVGDHEFKKDSASDEFFDKVQADLDSGFKSGVNGTPSIYINGKKYEDDDSFDSLLSYLKTLL